ncbi:MAG: hypothetical protein AAF383_06910 [Cyanobacteria bacterium P01_A01_bin.83]
MISDKLIRAMTDRDWIDRGKADAWAGKPKSPPEHDPTAASMYDLGYCEGEIEKPPVLSDEKEQRQ